MKIVNNIKKIKQKYKSDCAPACIAMLFGISLKKALKLVHPKHKKGESYSTYTSKLFLFLRAQGLKVRKRYIKSLSEVKCPSILLISVDNKTYTNHAVIYDGRIKKIFDPSQIAYYRSNTGYSKVVRYSFLLGN